MLAKKKAGIVSVLIMLTIALTVFFGCAPVEIAPEDEDVRKPVTKDYQAQVGDILQVKASPDPEKLITAEDYEVAPDGSIYFMWT